MAKKDLAKLLVDKDQLLTSADKELLTSIKDTERIIFESLKAKLGGLKIEGGKFIDDQAIAGFTSDIYDAFQNSPLPGSVTRFMRNFDTIEKLNKTITGRIEGIDLDKFNVSKEKRAIVKQVSDGLGKPGLRTNIAVPLNTILTRHVVLGTSVAEAEQALRAWLISNPDKQGNLQRYVRQVSMDALNQYDGAINQRLATELDMDHFAYVGSLIKTSRQNCRSMLDPKGKFGDLMRPNEPGIFPMSAIPEIVKRARGGNGWNEATTPDTFFIYRMGYNCRHMVQPMTLTDESLDVLKEVTKKGERSLSRQKALTAEAARKAANALTVNRSKYKAAVIAGKQPTDAMVNAYNKATAAQRKRIDDAIAAARAKAASKELKPVYPVPEVTDADKSALSRLEAIKAQDKELDPGLLKRTERSYAKAYEEEKRALGRELSGSEEAMLYRKVRTIEYTNRKQLAKDYETLKTDGLEVENRHVMAFHDLPKEERDIINGRIKKRIRQNWEEKAEYLIKVQETGVDFNRFQKAAFDALPDDLKAKVRAAAGANSVDGNSSFAGSLVAKNVDDELPEFKRLIEEFEANPDTARVFTQQEVEDFAKRWQIFIKGSKSNKYPEKMSADGLKVVKWSTENFSFQPDKWAKYKKWLDETLEELQVTREAIIKTTAQEKLLARKLRNVLVEGRKPGTIKVEIPKSDLEAYKNMGRAGAKRAKQIQDIAAAAEMPLEWLNKFIGPKIADGMKVKVAPPRGRGRAYFVNSRSGDEYIGTVHATKSAEGRTFVHEITHGIEYGNIGLFKKVVDYFQKRTKWQQADQPEVTNMKKLKGGDYGVGEVTLPADFYSPYVGRFYVGNRYKGLEATEVLTMGVDKMYENPLKLYREDRDHFDFIFSLFRQ